MAVASNGRILPYNYRAAYWITGTYRFRKSMRTSKLHIWKGRKVSAICGAWPTNPDAELVEADAKRLGKKETCFRCVKRLLEESVSPKADEVAARYMRFREREKVTE